MSAKRFNINEEQQTLVLARLRTLNPDSKIMLGGTEEISVRELIEHVESGDEFGQNIVKVQMKMLRILATGE